MKPHIAAILITAAALASACRTNSAPPLSHAPSPKVEPAIATTAPDAAAAKNKDAIRQLRQAYAARKDDSTAPQLLEAIARSKRRRRS